MQAKPLIIRHIRTLKGTLRRWGTDVHWNSSDLSAHSPVCRTTKLVLLLVCIAAASVYAETATTTTHKKPSPGTLAQTAQNEKATRVSSHQETKRSNERVKDPSAEHTSVAHVSTEHNHQQPAIHNRQLPRAASHRRARMVAAADDARPEHRAREHRTTLEHRATPEEIGRAAGLRIRAELERQEREARLEAAARLERAGLVRTTPELERTTEPRPVSRPVTSTHDQAQWAVAHRDKAEVDGRDEDSAEASDEGDQPVTASNFDFLAPPSTRNLLATPEETYLTIPHLDAALRGSAESLQRQNARTEADGLTRIESESDLAERIARKLLVPIPVSSALSVNPDLLPNHRYCRPWTARFLADLAAAHDAVFHHPLVVSSAVRTVEYQEHLMRINGNAAPAEGDIVSPHLTGAAVDIVKDGMSRRELDWMRSRLVTFELAGKLDVEEEYQQACFHITVYKSYLPQPTERRNVNPGNRRATSKPAPPTQIAAEGQ